MVDHNILLNKLSHYGIRGLAHKWFKSYLHDRSQYVSLNGKQSCTQSLKYGVPQGSILGPLLFIIYINDLPNIHNTFTFILYADDANIIIKGKTLHEIDIKFRILGDSLMHWVKSNGLSLNIRKTHYMIFSNKKLGTENLDLTINSIPIDSQETARFLGVLVDNKLSWKKHIAALSKKLNQNVGILIKVKGIFPLHVLKTLYHSFIQSHLNYCSLVWGHGCKSSLNSIFVAQKKAVRVIAPGYVNFWYDKKTGKTPSHTKPFFSELALPTVYTIVLQNTLFFMQKIHTCKAPQPILNMFSVSYECIPNTCYKYFNTHSPRLKCQRNSIFYEGPRLFNDTLTEFTQQNPTANTETRHNNLKAVNPKPFKRIIKSYLIGIQGCGDLQEWEFSNFRLYKGSRSSSRNKQEYISRTELYDSNKLKRNCLTDIHETSDTDS